MPTRKGISVKDKKVLVLGTGGAASAVFYALKTLGAAETYACDLETDINYSNVYDRAGDAQVIVNCTPVGMYPNVEKCPELPYEAMDSHNLLYDLIYNPDQTMFMQKGAANGAVVKNGLEMLLLQAFESWNIWNE
jgi:shikimate dehydrogenase